MNKEKKEYLTATELADRWQISAASLSNWRTEGKGPPYFKVNPDGDQATIIRYRLQDVIAYEEKQIIGKPKRGRKPKNDARSDKGKNSDT